MKVAIASDHGGFALKGEILRYLEARGAAYRDFGTHSADSCDYPPIAAEVARAVASGQYTLGFLLCGTGVGMSIAANKVPGARAACCSDSYSARHARLHNDANILCLGGRVVGAGLACELVELFLDTAFEGGRHARRVDLIRALEGEGQAL